MGELDETDYEALSALLDFYSDRAVAHVSFLVASVFGLFAVLSFIKGGDPVRDGVLSLVYAILWLGGFYSLFNFNHYAREAQRIVWMIEKKKKLVLNHLRNEIKTKKTREKKPNRIYLSIRNKFLSFRGYESKFPIMLFAYFCISLLAWLATTGILSWLSDKISYLSSVQFMGLTTSQTFIILGLVFEFLSVVISVRKLFSGYYDRLKKGTFREQIRKERIEGSLILSFLIIGMALQIFGLQI